MQIKGVGVRPLLRTQVSAIHHQPMSHISPSFPDTFNVRINEGLIKSHAWNRGRGTPKNPIKFLARHIRGRSATQLGCALVSRLLILRAWTQSSSVLETSVIGVVHEDWLSH